jgi:uracil-DNA glycosylase
VSVGVLWRLAAQLQKRHARRNQGLCVVLSLPRLFSRYFLQFQGNTKKDLQDICLKHFAAIVQLLKPKIIIAIGRWSEDRVKELAKQQRIDAAIDIRCLAHPSPRSLNNTDWPQKAEKWFADNDLLAYFQASA